MNQDTTVILVPFQESDFVGNRFMDCKDCAISRAVERQTNGLRSVGGNFIVFGRHEEYATPIESVYAVQEKFKNPSLPLPAPFLQEVPTSCLKVAPSEVVELEKEVV